MEVPTGRPPEPVGEGALTVELGAVPPPPLPVPYTALIVNIGQLYKDQYGV